MPDRPPFDRPAVIFCATQRCGSIMVVDDFQNLTGRPLTPQTEGFYRFVLAPKDPAMTWDRAMETLTAHRAGEAVFFDKVMYHYLPQLSRMIDPKGHDAVCTPFARYFAGAVWVHIRRADVFAQVVSKYFAETLNIWEAGQSPGPDFNAREPFEIEKAKVHLKGFLWEDRQWQIFFARHRIKPVEIYYEDAVESYPFHLAPVFDALGMTVDLAAPPPRRMAKLGNARNRVLATMMRDAVLRDLISNSFEMREFFQNRFL